MITLNIHEAKTQLSALLVQVEDHGEVVRICRNGKPVAQLTAIPKRAIDPLVQHPELAGRILYDPVEPATDEDWPEEFR
jgi:prevent-host-death family protein